MEEVQEHDNTSERRGVGGALVVGLLLASCVVACGRTTLGDASADDVLGGGGGRAAPSDAGASVPRRLDRDASGRQSATTDDDVETTASQGGENVDLEPATPTAATVTAEPEVPATEDVGTSPGAPSMDTELDDPVAIVETPQSSGTADSGMDPVVTVDAGPAPESRTRECDCNNHQVCDPDTGSCSCDVGYAGVDCEVCAENYVPAGPGSAASICIYDVCLDVTCPARSDCSTEVGGVARCFCDEGLSGQQCDERWQYFPLVDRRVTSDGNVEDVVVTEYTAREVALDAQGDLWVVANWSLYRFDPGETPFDQSDDSWISAGRGPDERLVTSVVADPIDGLWVSAIEQNPAGPSDEFVYRVHTGDADSPADDTWTLYTRTEQRGIYWTVYGVDHRGNVWIRNSDYLVGSEAIFLLHNESETPADGSDDVQAAFTAADLGITESAVIGFDPDGGAWFNGGHAVDFDPGSDTPTVTEAAWMMHEGDSPEAFVLDAAGSRWFGYPARADGETLDIKLKVVGGEAGSPTALWFRSDIDAVLPSLESHTWELGVHDIRVDGYGLKWLALSHGRNSAGILVTLDDAGTPFDPADDTWVHRGPEPRSLSEIYDFVVDDDSDVWLATEAGLAHVHLVER